MSRFSGIIVFCLAAVCAAQTPDTAGIAGRVVDATKAGVPGAQVTVRNTPAAIERRTTTDATGHFSFAGLPVGGEYEIVARKDGFADARGEDLRLSGGATATVTLELALSGGQTQMTVTGVAGEVRTDEPQLGVHIDAAQAEEVPLLNRRVTSLPLLNAANRPAINQGDIYLNQTLFTSNGAGRRQTWFEIDGVSGNDAWGRQTTFSTVPLMSLEEMTVLTNAFSAEFGAGAGTVVNIVTKSGTSELHGEAVEVWRPAETAAALAGFTAATASTGNAITSDQLGQSALGLGGPLGGKTFFSIGGELSREERGSPVISPLAPGIFVGHYRQWLGFLRLDREINGRHRVFLRSQFDRYYDTNPSGTVGGNSLPSVARTYRRRTFTEALGETATLGASVVNNFRAQFQLASPITQFDPAINGTQYVVPISSGGTFTSGTSQSALLLNRQYEANDVLSVIRGRHQLRFGADAIVAHSGGNSKEFGGPIYLGQFTYNPCTRPIDVCESAAYLGDLANVRSYTQSYGNARYTVTDTLWSAFMQDDIRAARNLTLNAGVRYDRQTFTDSTLGFAPRLGFAYNAGGAGTTVVRGGFGVYYSQIIDNAAANWALGGPNGVFNYTASAGQIGFPASVAAAPLPALPAGAAVPVRSLYVRPGDSRNLDPYFPTNVLVGYPDKLLNPDSKQWTLGVERRLATDWVLSVDYVGSHTSRINRARDVDPPAPFVRTAPGQVRTPQAANCTRPYWIWWYGSRNTTCNPAATTNPQPPYALIQSDVNDGYLNYHALDVNLTHRFSRKLSLLASYTWSHALDNVDPDQSNQNPNDPNFTGRVEYGNAIFDQRHRLVLNGVWIAPGGVQFGGIATLATGLPYNYVTGANNSGDGATADRPVIGSVVVGRNVGRGTPIYEVSPFLERPFAIGGEKVKIVPRLEAFNVFNHVNFVGFSGTWGNGAAPGVGFGSPTIGITSQLPARSLQFQLRVAF
jgi:hypothetical protein